MGWIPVAAWGGAVLVAVVVLGFCSYELVWKTNRLRRDVLRLRGLTESVDALRTELSTTQQRIASTREQ